MADAPLLQPKEITIEDGSETRTYLISKFPAIAGRRIIANYPLSALPKLGDYSVNEATMIELMGYVAVPRENGEPMRLSTPALINNHLPSWEALAKIEGAMLEYNCSFFTVNGALQGFIDLLLEKAAPTLSKILILSLQALSNAAQQPTSNSET